MYNWVLHGKTQWTQHITANRHRTPTPWYLPDHNVWLPLQLESRKSPHFVRAFSMSKLISLLAVHLCFLQNMKIHPAFNVSFVKPQRESALQWPDSFHYTCQHWDIENTEDFKTKVASMSPTPLLTCVSLSIHPLLYIYQPSSLYSPSDCLLCLHSRSIPASHTCPTVPSKSIK